MTVFLATLGQRPQAITMALDVLLPRFDYEGIGLLHTEPEHSGIAHAYEQLQAVLRRDFDSIPLVSHEITYPNGDPLLDIVDQLSAEAYRRAIFEVLKGYRAQHFRVHLLVAGGRKAMSVYATLAAAELFGEHDRVWTVLAADDLMRLGAFHIPPGRMEDVHVVHLPVQPSRLLPEVIAHTDADTLLRRRLAPRERFLKALTPQEKVLLERLRADPYASNQKLSDDLGKSLKTIDNQLRSIYGKLAVEFDLDVPTPRKRQLLLDVMEGRV